MLRGFLSSRAEGARQAELRRPYLHVIDHFLACGSRESLAVEERRRSGCERQASALKYVLPEIKNSFVFRAVGHHFWT
jgi:hypothetical protein